MSIITSEIAAQIVELTAEGKTAGKIAQELKIKKALIVAHLAESATELASAIDAEAIKLVSALEQVSAEDLISVPVVELPAADVVAPDSAASRLKAMLDLAKSATPVVEPTTTLANAGVTRSGNIKVVASSSKNADGTNKQRRNTNVGDRAVAVITSETMKTCFIGTHLGFATKTNAGGLNVFRTAPQQALKVMQKAEDLVLVLEYTNIALGDHLDALKATAFAKYEALGYQMLCRRPKAAPIVEEAVVVEETVEEAVVVEEATA